VREYPIFLPYEGEHIAGIITVPDPDPEAVALLLQGVGAPRSHRYRVWTRIAHGLADIGIASVRMDYRGMGDSTGPVGLDWDAPPVELANAVAAMAVESLGVDRLGVVGNCLGAKTGLQVAQLQSSCRSVACVLPGTYEAIMDGTSPALHHRLTRRLIRGLSRAPGVRRRVEPSWRRREFGKPIPDVSRALRSAQVLFLYFGAEEGFGRLAHHVEKAAAENAQPRAHSYEVSHVPADGYAGFQPLPAQEVLVERVTAWLARTLLDTNLAASVSDDTPQSPARSVFLKSS
jgi:pimeloyl-ACP methyl ester carboxylesterase